MGMRVLLPALGEHAEVIAVITSSHRENQYKNYDMSILLHYLHMKYEKNR